MMSTGHGQFKIRLPISEKSALYRHVIRCFIGSICILFAGGCAQLPAIDPNGQSIFLPAPASTDLRIPRIHANSDTPGILPQQAFPAPAAPAPCLDGSCPEENGIHNFFKHKKAKKVISSRRPGAYGEIQLTPMRVVAPVHGEVLLLAGICGKDGHLVKREPLEWMLSPDSVGQFIEVGDDAKGKLCSAFRSGPKVEKLDVDFAKGRTSSKETIITKGTPNCDDDIELKDGQTWLTVSSPTEGVSRVTVLAPDSELWDRRRQTAIIYWVDSQAVFPESQVVIGGPQAVQGSTLITRVFKSEGIVPAEGWLVRYTLIEPRIATFVRDDRSPIDSNIVPTNVNKDGQAIAILAAPPGTLGTQAIHMEVIRPAEAETRLPELVLHQADTFVSYSSPGLEVTAFTEREAVSVGDTVTIFATLANPGDITAENSKLVANLPTGTELVDAVPRPNSIVPGALEWDQQALGALAQLNVSITLRMLAAQDSVVRFIGTASPNLGPITREVPLRAQQPSVELRFAPSRAPNQPEALPQAEVGEIIYYDVDATNRGSQTLVNLDLEIEVAPGLEIVGQNSKKVANTFSLIAPQQTVPSPLAFRVLSEDNHRAVLTARSGDKVLAQRETTIRGLPRRPRLPILESAIQLPPQSFVGDSTPVTAVVQIRNRGTAVLSNIGAEITFDPVLEPRRVDNRNIGRVQLEAGRLRWQPPDLQPEQVETMQIEFVAKAPSPQAIVQISASNGQTNDTKNAQTQVTSRMAPPVTPPANAAPGGIFPPGAANPAVPPQVNPQAPVRTGEWSIRIIDLGDPITVNSEARYYLEVINNQNQADRNVRIQLGIPQGVELLRVTDSNGNDVPRNYVEDRVVELPKIEYFRVGEMRFSFVIVPKIPQQMRLLASVSSDAIPTPKQTDEPVTVIAR